MSTGPHTGGAWEPQTLHMHDVRVHHCKESTAGTTHENAYSGKTIQVGLKKIFKIS